MILLEGDGHTILLPDGEDLRLQLAVPPPQLLQLPLCLGTLHAHHLVDSHTAPLCLPQQTLVLLLQSALIKHTGTSFTPPATMLSLSLLLLTGFHQRATCFLIRVTPN